MEPLYEMSLVHFAQNPGLTDSADECDHIIFMIEWDLELKKALIKGKTHSRFATFKRYFHWGIS